MTDKMLKRVLNISLWTMLGISAIVLIVFAYQVSQANEDRELLVAASNAPIVWAYVLCALATFTALLFPTINVIRYPKTAVKLLISVAVLVVVFLVAYALADPTPIETATSGTNPDFSDRGVLLFTDTGIIATYILTGMAILALLLAGVKGALKR